MKTRTLESKLVAWDELHALGDRLRAEKKRIVTTNGCFDLIHLGHIRYLNEARALGDVLVVGVNSDSSVRELKGPTRPLVDEKTRALQLAGLEAVDYVAVFSESLPVLFLDRIRPHIHVKGGDYEPEKLPERAVVEKHGGKVVCVSLVEGFSTTNLIKKLRQDS